MSFVKDMENICRIYYKRFKFDIFYESTKAKFFEYLGSRNILKLFLITLFELFISTVIFQRGLIIYNSIG